MAEAMEVQTDPCEAMEIQVPTDAGDAKPQKQVHPECLYHSKRWKSRYQCALNRLQQEKTLKHEHIKLACKLVCICGISDIEPIPVGDVEKVKKFFRKVDLSEKVSAALKPMLDKLLPETVSLYRFLFAVSRAHMKDFQPFTEAKFRGKPKASQPEQVGPVIASKKIQVRLQPDWIGIFIGDKGVHIKEIQQKHAGTRIAVGIERGAHRWRQAFPDIQSAMDERHEDPNYYEKPFNPVLTDIDVEVFGPDEASVDAVLSDVIAHAKDVTDKQKKRFQDNVDYQKVKEERRRQKRNARMQVADDDASEDSDF